MLETCPQVLCFHIRETRTREGLRNEVSVCNCIGLGWIVLGAGGCSVAARFFSTSPVSVRS
jgi:hypothetical protein